MSVLRPEWDDYFQGIAKAVAARGDCTRRQVGAVIVNSHHRVIATGYNGAPPGDPSCLEGACPRGRHFAHYGWHGTHGSGTLLGCNCGKPLPCPDAVAPGSSYDTGIGSCIALHAEANALLYAFRSVRDMTMYITDEPCDGCVKLLRGAQISRVVTPSSEFLWDLSSIHDYRSPPCRTHRPDPCSR